MFLIHPYFPSMAPLKRAFREGWPEARVFNILDESLYADIGEDGTLPPDIPGRIRILLDYAAAAKANAVVFSGSTFGPAVEEARQGIGIPVLKADEALARAVARRPGKIVLMSTIARSARVVEGSIRAASPGLEFDTIIVREAKGALEEGNEKRHDELIAEAALKLDEPGTIVFGQVSMTGAIPLLPKRIRDVILTSAGATVSALREELG